MNKNVMSRNWWFIIAIPILAPASWFYWDPNYYIYGGDTPTWGGFQYLIEWHFPNLWDEFDGAGHPFANNAALPTAFFFWVLWKLSFSTLLSQILFFITLSSLSVAGVYRIGKLYFKQYSLLLFVFVTSVIYLLNPFGFYGENRRIFTTEFVVAYYLLPLFVSYFIVALSNEKFIVKEALLAAATTIALHNFNLVPSVSYIGITYVAIAVYAIAYQRGNIRYVIKFFLIFLILSIFLAAYHLFAMIEYYNISSLASDLSNIVSKDPQSTTGSFVKTLMFTAGGLNGGRESPLIILAYLFPVFVGVAMLFHAKPHFIVGLCGTIMIVSLFFMDVGYLATKLFGVTDVTSFFYAIFRFPHIKFTAPYILSIAFLCGLAMTHYENNKYIVIIATVLFIVFWNARIFTHWLPIQLKKPEQWLEISEFMQDEKEQAVFKRTLKVPSGVYFKDGVGGEEFARTPPHRKLGASPWMVHGSALGLLLPQPMFSLNMSPGARLNPCVDRIFHDDISQKEMLALFSMLGIERMLLSTYYTFQRQYTPITKIKEMQILMKKFRSTLLLEPPLFQNKAVSLQRIAVDHRPIIYTADRLENVSSEAFSTCDFARLYNYDDNLVFYSELPPGELLTDINGLVQTNIKVSYKREAASKYRIRLHGMSKKGMVVLVLNNSYADWVLGSPLDSLLSSDFRDRRFSVNGFATAWIIDASKLCKNIVCTNNISGGYDVDLSISYAPQRVYEVLFMVMILGVVIIILLINVRYRIVIREDTM